MVLFNVGLLAYFVDKRQLRAAATTSNEHVTRSRGRCPQRPAKIHTKKKQAFSLLSREIGFVFGTIMKLVFALCEKCEGKTVIAGMDAKQPSE